MVLRTDDFSHNRLGVFGSSDSQVKRERFRAIGIRGRRLKKLDDNAAGIPQPCLSSRNRSDHSCARVRTEHHAKLFICRQPSDGQLQRVIFVEYVDTHANRWLMPANTDQLRGSSVGTSTV